MAKPLTLSWSHFGPPRPSSGAAVPPIPSLIDGYVLAYDEGLAKIVYGCVPDGETKARLHAFDGGCWSPVSQKPFSPPGEKLLGGGYDPGRQGVVWWASHWDALAASLVKSDGSMAALKMRGDLPIAEEDGKPGALDEGAIFVLDPGRQTWVCLTRCGAWEFAADGTWSQRADAAKVPEGWKGVGTGAYDTLQKRIVFQLMVRTPYKITYKDGYESGVKYPSAFLAWDGKTLDRLDSDGLPELQFGSGHACAQLASHPRHGLVLHAGAGRLFSPQASPGKLVWQEHPTSPEPPARLADALLAYDPGRDLYVLGPGKHEGAGGSDRQGAFYILRGAGRAWERQGTVVRWSLLASHAQPSCRLAHVQGSWIATGADCLLTWKWSDEGWQPLVGYVEPNRPEIDVLGAKDRPVRISQGGWQLDLVATDRLWAVSESGATYVLDGQRWRIAAAKHPAFKNRRDFTVAACGDGRIVVWGGSAGSRKLNDTLILEDGKWRPAKKSSPPPSDFKHGDRDEVWPESVAAYDGVLGCVVRFGYEEVALLEDEVWKPCTPKSYKKLISERKEGHFPCHDPETGETLLVDLPGKRIVRFDLGECTVVAAIAFPKELEEARDSFRETAAGKIDESFSYDPGSRALYAQHIEDAYGVYRLDLGEAFDRARALGPRKLPKGAPAKGAAGKAGVSAAKPARPTQAAKPAKPAKPEKTVPVKMTPQLAKVLDQVLTQSREITVGKATREPVPSHLAGLPAKVTAANWPRAKGKPMRFLFQLRTDELLRRHAAVAVFSGEDDECAVVLLSQADLAKPGSAPEGVEVPPSRSLIRANAKLEIDEAKALPFAQADPEVGAYLENLADKSDTQSPELASKLGGLPRFLQEDATPKRHVFVAQLDFEAFDADEIWPDAGLQGCIYVFVQEDEKGGLAFWQAT
jgi:hypothetical protein